MTVNAAYIITQAMHQFRIIDETEQPTATDLANFVPILNDLLRSEQADGACQYLITRVTAVLPQGVAGSIYTFSIGTANSSYLVQQDAVVMRALYMNDIVSTVNRPTRQAPIADVVRTMQPGIITRWHQERQLDNSILITAWQPPRASSTALIELGLRVPALTNPAGTDIVPLPSEGIQDAILLLGRRVHGSKGVVIPPSDPILMDAEAANMKWKNYARGQQWLRFMRS